MYEWGTPQRHNRKGLVRDKGVSGARRLGSRQERRDDEDQLSSSASVTLVSRLGGRSFPFVTASSRRRNRISSHDLSTPNAMM